MSHMRDISEMGHTELRAALARQGEANRKAEGLGNENTYQAGDKPTSNSKLVGIRGEDENDCRLGVVIGTACGEAPSNRPSSQFETLPASFRLWLKPASTLNSLIKSIIYKIRTLTVWTQPTN